MNELDPFLETARPLIESALADLVADRLELPYAHLFSAARYSLLSSAKRLRPLLVLATVKSYHVDLEKALLPACAIEMVHTYSLIHDDLPCMDNDDFRRGKPTLHKVYPEGHAVLTGDYLLTFAFQVLSDSPHLSDSQKIALVHSLSKHAGSQGMIGGQVIDLASENRIIDWETLEMMHLYKTAGLIIAALEFGAIIADAPLSDRKLLSAIGAKIGIAFQIIDDVLDLTGSLEEMGKLSGSDENKKKSTALSMMTSTECQAKAEELLNCCVADLDKLSHKAPLLLHLFHQLIYRNH